jgi:colanic acid/amylovoran biosynthesis protein
VAIYSTSIGPFSKNFLFKLISIYTLKRLKFLSLRDAQSQKYASKLGIKYIAALDTAFMPGSLPIKLPSQLQNLEKEKYVVIVPNEIYAWHKLFNNIDEKYVDSLYLEIIECFLKKNLKVVLLPQRYGRGYDTIYFKKLSTLLSGTNNLEIIPEVFNCDVQQEIINHSQFLVGVRYHSIVFAIKGAVPFFALSYEHKITHMLSFLNLQQYCMSLKRVLDRKEALQVLQKIESLYKKRNVTKNTLISTRHQAQRTAQNTFLAFEKFIEELSHSSRN